MGLSQSCMLSKSLIKYDRIEQSRTSICRGDDSDDISNVKKQQRKRLWLTLCGSLCREQLLLYLLSNVCKWKLNIHGSDLMCSYYDDRYSHVTPQLIFKLICSQCYYYYIWHEKLVAKLLLFLFLLLLLLLLIPKNVILEYKCLQCKILIAICNR